MNQTSTHGGSEASVGARSARSWGTRPRLAPPARPGTGPPRLRPPRDVRATLVHEQLQQPHHRFAPAPAPQAPVTVGAHTEEGVIHAKQPSY
jgi:hypothetical protein